jgi:hypothetical protein
MILDYLPDGSKAWVINLDERKDRLDSAIKACSTIGLEFERMPAINGSSQDIKMKEYPNSIKDVLDKVVGWNKNSAARGHTTIKIIEDAKKNDYPAILIMEDDVEFVDNLTLKKMLDLSMGHLPEDWESINFGGIQNKPHKKCVGGFLHLIASSEFCHCYVLRNTVYDKMLEWLSKVDKPLDHVTAWDLHSRGKSYAIYPNAAFQAAGYSNIRDRTTDYLYLR